MNCSMPGFPVLHYLSEFAQTYVHWVSDAIQTSCPLWHPSPAAFTVSQHQSLYQWAGSSHHVAKVLSFIFNISLSNEYSGLISFRTDWFDLLPYCPTDSLKSSSAPQLESINSSALSLLYSPTLTSMDDCLKNDSFNYTDFCWQIDVSAF